MKYASSRLTSSIGCQLEKHGPRTILLKLLTILLSGSPYQWWTRQQGTAGLIPQQSQLKKLTLHVQLLSRAINALTVELVGIKLFLMSATVNTKNTIVWFFQDHQWKQRHAQVKQQASSVRHQAPIFRKLQASGDKLQAPGSKLQASSHKRQAPRS